MLCTDCGEPIDEGKAFCRHCGAPAPTGPDLQAGAAGADAGAAAGAAARPDIPPPPAGFTPPPPVDDLDATVERYPGGPMAPPPPGYLPVSPAPPQPMGGYGPAWQPPQGPPPRGNRTGLIVGSLAAAIIVLAGLGVGLYFGLRGDDGDKAGPARTDVSTTESGGSDDTLEAGPLATGGQTGTTEAGAVTTQTIPSLTGTTAGGTVTTGSAVTTTTVDPLDAWYVSHDELVAELDGDDARIPELATQINSTAPDVPDWVHEELAEMHDVLTALMVTMDETPVPPAFAGAHDRLMEAADHMAKRIVATMDGIDTMWDTGSINAATADFNKGRAERDAYRAAMAEHWDLMPAD